MFNEVLNDVKNKEGKKVNLNILIQPSMKESFDKLCKENGTTMTAMMIGFIEKSLKDNPDYTSLTNEQLKIEEITLEHKLENTQNYLESISDNEFNDEELCSMKSSIYTNIRLYNNQLEKVTKELYK